MGEKITNGTCETWSSATVLDDWAETLNGTSTINREDSEQYAGAHCIRFDIDASKSQVLETQSITLVADTYYLFTFWYKGSETSGTAMQYGLRDDENSDWLDGDAGWESRDLYDGGPTASHTTTWTKASVLFKTHATHTAYTLNFKNATGSSGVASCQVYIDNISIDDTLVDHESDGITLADVGGSGRQTVFDSVSVKDDFKYYLASSEGKIFTYSGDYLSDDGSVILSRWRSKTLDFADQIPDCAGRFSELTGVRLVYKDLTTDTDVTISASTDGGATWDHQTKTLGTGSGRVLSDNFHFIKTGEFFIFAIEHASTDKEFMWLQMEASVVPLGASFDIRNG